MIAAANFIAVLNMTVANVSVPSIAGALGAATSQGTWVITSFAVGEAVTVPLTGWLAGGAFRRGAPVHELDDPVRRLFHPFAGWRHRSACWWSCACCKACAAAR